MNRIFTLTLLLLLSAFTGQAQNCTGATQLKTGDGAAHWMEAYGPNRLVFGGIYYNSSQPYFAFDGDTLRHRAGDIATVFVVITDTSFNLVRMFNGPGFRSTGGAFNDMRVWNMAVDRRMNILFAGSYAQDTLVYGADTVMSDTYQEAFLTKTDSTGNPLLLKSFGSRSFGGQYHYEDRAHAVTTDYANNIYVAASFDGDYFEINGDTANNGIPVGLNSYKQSVVFSLTPQGATRWVKAFGAPGPDDNPLGMDADSAGNVTVCGATSASNQNFIFGPFTYHYKLSTNGYQGYICRLDNAGTPLWLYPLETYVGTGPDVNAYDVAVDNGGSSYVTGSFDYYAIFNGDTVYTPAATSGYLCKINSAGQTQFIKTGNTDTFYPYPATVKAQGNKVFITGQSFTNNLAFDHLGICCSAESYFAMYDTSGTLQWLKAIQTTGGADGVVLDGAVSNRGTAYACGAIDGGQVTIEPLTVTASSASDFFMVRFGTLTSNGLTVDLINNSNDTINCGLAVSLHAQATALPNVRYFWSADNDTIPGTFFTANTSGSPKSTTTYYVAAYVGGCVAVDSTVVTVIPIYVNAGTDTTICAGTPLQLIGNQQTNLQGYNWSPADSLSNDTIFNPVANPTQTTNYVYTIRAQGCMNSDTVTVNVNPLAVASFTMSANLLTLTVTNTSQYGTSYVISYGDGTVDSVTTAGVTTHTYTHGGDFTICVTAINDCNTDVTCQFILMSAIGINEVDAGAYVFADEGQSWNITSKLSSKGYTAEVMESNGRLVSRSMVNDKSVRISKDGLSSGIYLIRLISVEGQKTFKAIVTE